MSEKQLGNSLEQILARIWKDLLDVDHVGSNDNFFDLGGDSFTFMLMLAEANSEGLQFNLSEFFSGSDISGVITIPYLASCLQKDNALLSDATE